MRWRPFDPGLKHNPYPHYAQQAAQTTTFISTNKIAYVLDHPTVKKVLSDGERYSSPTPPKPRGFDLSTYGKMADKCLFFIDGNLHVQTRKLAHAAISYTGLEARIQEVANELYRKLEFRKGFDFISEFAEPLTANVMGEILGFCEYGISNLSKWANALILSLDVFSGSKVFLEMEEASRELESYLEGRFLEDKTHLESNLITNFLAGLKRLNLGQEEVVQQFKYMVTAIVMAGADTTVGLLGNGFSALINHPEEIDRFQKDPKEMLGTAVDELLRFDSSVQFVLRRVEEDHELNGVVLKKGQALAIGLGAANRDPHVFENPDQLDLSRTVNPHVSFAFGAHYCLGARIAKLEIAASLRAWQNDLDTLKLMQEAPTYRRSNILKVPESLMLSNSRI